MSTFTLITKVFCISPRFHGNRVWSEISLTQSNWHFELINSLLGASVGDVSSLDRDNLIHDFTAVTVSVILIGLMIDDVDY